MIYFYFFLNGRRMIRLNDENFGRGLHDFEIIIISDKWKGI